EEVGDLAGDAEDVGEVGRAVLAGRRREREEEDVRGFDGLGEVRREVEAVLAEVPLEEPLDAGLEDGELAAAELLDLPLVDVHADDVVPHLGEARARDEADVAGSDNSDLHSIVVTWGPRPSGNGKGRRR